MNQKRWILFYIVLSAIVFGHLQGYDSLIEFRGSGFYHTSHRFRSIYGDWNPDYQIEIARDIPCNFQVWLNGDWEREKTTIEHCGSTRFRNLNISLGLRYIFARCCRLNPYIGLGPSFGFFKLENTTCCKNEKVKCLATGLVVKSGIYYRLSNRIFLDGFVDYLYQPTNFHVDIGGVKIGGGIGFKF